MANWLEGTGELSQEWNIAYIFSPKELRRRMLNYLEGEEEEEGQVRYKYTKNMCKC